MVINNMKENWSDSEYRRYVKQTLLDYILEKYYNDTEIDYSTYHFLCGLMTTKEEIAFSELFYENIDFEFTELVEASDIYRIFDI